MNFEFFTGLPKLGLPWSILLKSLTSNLNDFWNLKCCKSVLEYASSSIENYLHGGKCEEPQKRKFFESIIKKDCVSAMIH